MNPILFWGIIGMMLSLILIPCGLIAPFGNPFDFKKVKRYEDGYLHPSTNET